MYNRLVSNVSRDPSGPNVSKWRNRETTTSLGRRRRREVFRVGPSPGGPPPSGPQLRLGTLWAFWASGKASLGAHGVVTLYVQGFPLELLQHLFLPVVLDLNKSEHNFRPEQIKAQF